MLHNLSVCVYTYLFLHAYTMCIFTQICIYVGLAKTSFTNQYPLLYVMYYYFLFFQPIFLMLAKTV